MANVNENMLQITQKEFEAIVTEEIETITNEATKRFQEALEKTGLVLTSDLKNSFVKFVVSNSVAMIAQARMEFNAYGRFKDMRKYSFRGHIPPVFEMEYFIMKEGVENFKWILDYRHTKNRPSAFVSDERTINRIAWAIAMNKRRFPDVKRGYRGSWYNENKMKYINEVKKRLRWRINSAVHSAFRGAFDGFAKS